MSPLSPSFTEITVWGGYILRIVGYLVLSLALIFWCQRLRHWSFAVLSLNFLIAAGLNVVSLMYWAAHRGPSASSSGLNSAWMFFQQFAGLANAVLLLIGAVGLLLAVKQLRLVRDDSNPPSSLPQPPA